MKMKKMLVTLMAGLMLFTATTLPTSARNGDVINYALYTDIVAYINGFPIESFNVDGYTYVIAEDLEYYGFSVTWDGANRRLHIEKDPYDNWVEINYEPGYIPDYMIGVPAYDILETDIETYFDGYLVESYNINGRTIIQFDVLGWYGDVEWDPYWREIWAYLDWVNYTDTDPDYDDGEWTYDSEAWNEGYDYGLYVGYRTGWNDGLNGYEFGTFYNDYCDVDYSGWYNFEDYQDGFITGYYVGYEDGYGDGLEHFDWDSYFDEY